MTMDIFADDFTLNKKDYTKMQQLGINIDPVDMNGGFVALDKQSPDNLQKTQKNIQRRFELENITIKDI